MKFNEKLIKLRKEYGMSQEQLGFELNVTRQTVSKWELGISKPEMDKLIEMSKLFGVSVDELINEGKRENMNGNYQTDNNDYVGVDSKYIPKKDYYSSADNYKEQDTLKKEKFLKNAKKIGGAYLIFVILISILSISIFGFVIFTIFKIPKEVTKGEIMNYNYNFENRSGIRESKSQVESLINYIVTNNNNNTNKIIVSYNGQELKSNNEIENVDLKDFSNYKVSFEYNEEGYIYKAIIEGIKQEIDNEEQEIDNEEQKIEAKKYNRSFEIYGGINTATLHVESLINNILINNINNENKIIVTYNGQELKENSEIENIALKDFSNYKVTFQYNEEGYIYKAIIQLKQNL